ncbi:MAG: gliding motility protein GldL [Prevotella sp.]|nr:gliding motility protein GldL [Prevotella sp.]
MPTRYSKINFIYFMQKWMDSVPGQTFLNYAYSWGAAVVILGTLFKLTHLPGANTMLFIGMGTEVFVFFISAFDRPFDKTTIDMTLDNHMDDEVVKGMLGDEAEESATGNIAKENVMGNNSGVVIIGGGGNVSGSSYGSDGANNTEGINIPADAINSASALSSAGAVGIPSASAVITPAPAVTPETAEKMQNVTEEYVDRLAELNEMLEKVGQLTSRLSVDSEEMENLNRTLTGIARVYEMQLKSASQQITTQDSINEQTHIMAQKITELNNIYARMIEAMTTNMPKAQ